MDMLLGIFLIFHIVCNPKLKESVAIIMGIRIRDCNIGYPSGISSVLFRKDSGFPSQNLEYGQ